MTINDDTSHYEGALLEEIRDMFKALQEGYSAFDRVPTDIVTIKSDILEIKSEIIAIKAVVKDHSGLISKHEGRITKLEGSPA